MGVNKMASDTSRDNGTLPSPGTKRGAQVHRACTYLADGDPVDISDLSCGLSRRKKTIKT